ncbi:hypothetical protein M413DRAFT_346659 [Hebeloma cylindrosporum]|uniref:Uncharacterized protein n=1 Tax=Hebeloma cylindrosporum TaxID=76867 RepID=A0A0C2XCH7_HEBCY|nr:hypothetical protein M413DRAFT_346659 [Hebeloma cylindrosporum h7]
MAPSAAVNAMPPRVHGGPGASKIDPNPSSFNIREFVVDDSTRWQPIDQQKFVTAQREALEAYNIDKALRLSKATAAEESQRRTAAAAAIDATISISSASASGTARVVIAPVSEPQVSSAGRSSVAQSQPIVIKKAPATSDEAAAFSLARTWQVDALQVPLLENKQPAVTTATTTTTSSSSSSSNMSAKPKSSSTISHSSSSSHDKKASAPVSVSPKQRSQNISLSTSSFVDTASVPSLSRASAQSNATIASSQSHRIEQRPLSKRDPEPISNSSSSPSSSRPVVNSDVTSPKRPQRTASSSPPQSRSASSHAASVVAPSLPQSRSTSSRPASVVAASPPHSRSTSSHAASIVAPSPPQSRSTSSHAASVVAPSPPQSRSAPVSIPPTPDSKKSTASAKDVRLGLILNPSKENSMSPPPTPMEPSHPPRSRSADQTSEGSTDHQFLYATRNCMKCGTLVPSPRSSVCNFSPSLAFVTS